MAARIADLADTLLQHPEFRAARLGVRQRVGRTIISTLDTAADDSVAWEALRIADEQIETLAATAYQAVQANLDRIVRELVTNAEFRAAATAGARNRVTEKVLTAVADGFAPSAYLRNEVTTRAYRQLRGLSAHQ
ncbi:hypothetical protein AB0K00_22705 [Dactylosporangium sp. NPDC049525]|uniref:hypothetical protein n=1 Tax=Dactylosporangium sp. NPDC049525 TaxID=3154730 RepID=UPI0034244DB6